MLLSTNRRVHLQQRADIGHIFGYAKQIVRLRLRGEAQSARLRVLHHLHGLPGAGVNDVELGPEGLRQVHDVRHVTALHSSGCDCSQ